jgi:hypothetical protein
MTNQNQAMLASSGGINYNHPQLLAIAGSLDSGSNQNTNRDLEKIIVPTGLPQGSPLGRNTTMMKDGHNNHFKNEAILDSMDDNTAIEHENINQIGVYSQRQE